jgi:hypothetical protein
MVSIEILSQSVRYTYLDNFGKVRAFFLVFLCPMFLLTLNAAVFSDETSSQTKETVSRSRGQALTKAKGTCLEHFLRADMVAVSQPLHILTVSSLPCIRIIRRRCSVRYVSDCVYFLD